MFSACKSASVKKTLTVLFEDRAEDRADDRAAASRILESHIRTRRLIIWWRTSLYDVEKPGAFAPISSLQTGIVAESKG